MNINRPSDPVGRRKLRDQLTAVFASLIDHPKFLPHIFRGTIKPLGAYVASVDEAPALCAKLKAFYSQRPRPWRRAADAPKQPKREAWRLRRGAA